MFLDGIGFIWMCQLLCGLLRFPLRVEAFPVEAFLLPVDVIVDHGFLLCAAPGSFEGVARGVVGFIFPARRTDFFRQPRRCSILNIVEP